MQRDDKVQGTKPSLMPMPGGSLMPLNVDNEPDDWFDISSDSKGNVKTTTPATLKSQTLAEVLSISGKKYTSFLIFETKTKSAGSALRFFFIDNFAMT